MSSASQDLIDWLRRQASGAGARGFVVGLSGGIDSAVVVRLCQLATPGHILGVMLPCDSDPRDEADALLVAQHFDIPTMRLDLAPSYERLLGDLQQAMDGLPPGLVPAAVHDAADPVTRLARANLKPRLRMTSLYYVANSLNLLVAGTGNRSELTIGYFTKYGDGGVDLLPIGRLLKSEVRALARELDIPAEIIDKPPSAGLWAGQTDEAEMGFSYADLESYLTRGAEVVSPAFALRIERLMRQSEHKRGLPPVPTPGTSD